VCAHSPLSTLLPAADLEDLRHLAPHGESVLCHKFPQQRVFLQDKKEIEVLGLAKFRPLSHSLYAYLLGPRFLVFTGTLDAAFGNW